MTYRTNDLETENKSLREKVAELEFKLKTIQERHIGSLHKWECRQLTTDQTFDTTNFNILAEQGWEFVTYKPNGASLFKRPMSVSKRPIPKVPDSE